jgi:antitoxin PrlF
MYYTGRGSVFDIVRCPSYLRCMIKSRISSRAQTVLPTVRQHLQVGAGDDVVYEIVKPGEVILRRAPGPARDDPFVLFDEWASAADEDAFADLPASTTTGLRSRSCGMSPG